MAFFDPEVSQPYRSLVYSYGDEDARLDADAARRAREFSAQSAATRGSRSARGPALNTYNRLMSDYTLGKASTDRANRLAYTGTMGGLMSRPGAITPSTLQTLGGIGGTIGGAVLKEAAPDIWKKSKDVLGWWDASPAQLTQQYNNLVTSGADTGVDVMGGAGSPYSSVTDYSMDWPGAADMAGTAYSSLFDSGGGMTTEAANNYDSAINWDDAMSWIQDLYGSW